MEQQVDSLKEAYNLVLPIVETVEVDGYDYPTNFRDSITDFGKTVSGKVRILKLYQIIVKISYKVHWVTKRMVECFIEMLTIC